MAITKQTYRDPERAQKIRQQILLENKRKANLEFKKRMMTAVQSKAPKRRGPYKKASEQELERRRMVRILSKYKDSGFDANAANTMREDFIFLNLMRNYINPLKSMYPKTFQAASIYLSKKPKQ